MTPQEQTIQSRITNTVHRDVVRNIFGLSTRLSNERTKLKADQTISEIGRREKEAAFAKSLVKDHVHLTGPLRRARADLEARRASFKLPAIDRTDSVGELRRQEIRAHTRSLPLDGRLTFVASLNDEQLLAVLYAPSLLSGLPQDRYEHIKSAYIDRQFGKQMRALEDVDEETTILESASTIVRRDLQKATGLGDVAFETLVESYGT